MNIVRRIVVGLAGVVVVALVLTLAEPKAVHAVVSALVTVSNGPGNPVPTMAVDTRNVNVVNTPNVNVTGLPAVQLTGTPSVNIANPLSIGGNVSATVTNPTGTNGPVPLLTQDSDNAARHSFDIVVFCSFVTSFGQTQCGFNIPQFFDVTSNPNEIVVVESLSGNCTLNSGTSLASVSLVSSNGGGSVLGQLFVVPGPTVPLVPTGVAQSFSQSIKNYFTVGGDQGISFQAQASGNETGASCVANVAGYTIQP